MECSKKTAPQYEHSQRDPKYKPDGPLQAQPGRDPQLCMDDPTSDGMAKLTIDPPMTNHPDKHQRSQKKIDSTRKKKTAGRIGVVLGPEVLR